MPPDVASGKLISPPRGADLRAAHDRVGGGGVGGGEGRTAGCQLPAAGRQWIGAGQFHDSSCLNSFELMVRACVPWGGV